MSRRQIADQAGISIASVYRLLDKKKPSTKEG